MALSHSDNNLLAMNFQVGANVLIFYIGMSTIEEFCGSIDVVMAQSVFNVFTSLK